MKSRRLLVLLALTSACALRPVVPPTQTSPSASASKPSVQPEAGKIVNAFVGTWVYRGKFTPSEGAPRETVENIDCRVTALGRALYCRDVSPDGGFEESQFIAYDHVERCVRLIIVNSHGEVSDHRCRWISDTTLACEPLELGSGDDRLTHTVTITAEGDRSTFHEVGTGLKGFLFDATGERAAR